MLKLKAPIYIFFLFVLCTCNKQEGPPVTIDDKYLADLEAYSDMIWGYRKSYLKIAGLFKLDSGLNTFGPDSSNNFIVKIKNVAPTLGAVEINGDSIFYIPNEHTQIYNMSDSSQIEAATYLALNEYGRSALLFNDRLKLGILTRNEHPYLRIWDENNPAVEAFTEFERYEIDPEFIVKGRFIYYNEPKTFRVPSIMGGMEDIEFIGQAEFEYNDKTYTLDVGYDGFTMVKDQTAGHETYGAGRYMYMNLPKKDSAIVVDFNRLYNPPCAFSEYTVCLFAPQQNVLPFAIKAGEKYKSAYE